VVVASGEGIQVAETVKRDRVFGGIVANSGGVATDLALSDIVGSLGTDEEAITAENSVSSDSWALQATNKVITRLLWTKITRNSYLEEIEDSTRVNTRLLVHGIEESMFLTLLREQWRVQVKLKPFDDLVLKFDLGFEHVGSSPSLSENDAVLEVGVLGLDISGDMGALVLAAGDFKGHARRCLGLDLERGTVEMVVLA
jgi:hypothetical protein